MFILLHPDPSSSSSSSSSSYSKNMKHRQSSRATSFLSFSVVSTALLALLATTTTSNVYARPSSTLNESSLNPSISKRDSPSKSPFAQLPNAVDFYNPNEKGGEMLTIIPNLSVGEPINIIISGRSSRSVLTPVGFLLWATSIDYGVSCLGSSDIGTVQSANLGDGRGSRPQGSDEDGVNGVLRYNYKSPYFGTCRETFEGGSHLRWFMQNGTKADSSAIFIAASTELSLALGHDIAPNGYNNGRDEIVGNATNPQGTSWEGNTYNTTVIWVPAGLLLNATSEGINHPDVAPEGAEAQDGRVAVLTVTQLAGSSSFEDDDSAAVRSVGKIGVATGLLTLCLAIFLALIIS